MNNNPSKYLWLLVSDDEYELPLMVEESPITLARRCGVKENSVYQGALRYEKGIKQGYFRRVRK